MLEILASKKHSRMIKSIRHHQTKVKARTKRHRYLLRADSERQPFTEQSIKGGSLGLARPIKESADRAVTHGRQLKCGPEEHVLPEAATANGMVGELSVSASKASGAKPRGSSQVSTESAVLIRSQNMV